jgi:hypothetical protein
MYREEKEVHVQVLTDTSLKLPPQTNHLHTHTHMLGRSLLPPPPELQPGEIGGKVTHACREVIEKMRGVGVMWQILKKELQEKEMLTLFLQVRGWVSCLCVCV